MSVRIIAEIGQSHDGSLGLLHSFIDAVSECGVDFIKFQTHIAQAESSDYEPFRVNFSYEDKTRYDYWRRMEFTLQQWREIKDHCEERKLEFVSSPFSNAAVDLLDEIGMNHFKIGSGEVNNLLLLEKIAKTGKEIWLSSGMSSFRDLDKSVRFIRERGNSIVVFQCTTQYPTTSKEIGLNVIGELRERYGLPVGLSDHSGTIYPGLAAVTHRAEFIEVHVTFDKRMFGPDSTSSLTLSELSQLVEGVRFLEESQNHPVDKDDDSKFIEIKNIFGKSLAVSQNMEVNDVVHFEILESKKPAGKGIPVQEYQQVVGKKLKRRLGKWDFLNWEDIQM